MPKHLHVWRGLCAHVMWCGGCGAVRYYDFGFAVRQRSPRREKR